MLTLPHKDNSESPIYLTCMFLDRSTRREPTHTQGEKKSCLAKDSNRLHWNFSSILSMHEATKDEETSGRTRLRKGGLDWLGLRGQERGDNKHHNTKPGIPAEREKHKLMTTIMPYVHRKWREQNEGRCILGGPPAVWAYSSITMGCFRVTWAIPNDNLHWKVFALILKVEKVPQKWAW